MAAQYWVGGFFIDLSRNQITQNKQSRTIAPKALAVLTYLAKNQGKVISQDEILDQVWQDTTVSPNTLQKSIAQLRKALGESGNVYIKTHAKQGYSLECDVRWQDALDNSLQSHLEHQPKSPETSGDVSQSEPKHADAERPSESGRLSLSPKMLVGTILVLAIALTLILINSVNFDPASAKSLEIKEIRALTATDNKEFSGIYSPDGKYVVFHRYSEEFCINNIWAKNTQTQEEFQLTKELDSYGPQSFSKDGKHLVFIKSHNCQEPVDQKACYKLMTLDFNQALSAPREPEVILECKHTAISKPTWLNDNDILLLQKSANRWKIVRYSISENKTTDVFRVEVGNLIDYDFSREKNLIALTTLDENNKAHIKIIKPDGEAVSSFPITYPNEIPKFRLLFPNFSPISDQLIFSTGKRLFTMSHQGIINRISLPLDEPMSSPLFHADGKRALVIKGHYDSDIANIPLSDFNAENTTVLERSTLAEDTGIFQPNGNLIAFESGRSGEEQVWLFDGKSSRQLTHFPIDSYIDGMEWSADGQSILVAVHGEISQISIDGKLNTFVFKDTVKQLFSWDSKTNTALVLIRSGGITKFAELDLTNLTTKILRDSSINWARYSAEGHIIYMDHLDRFWRPGPAEDQLIEKLVNQGSIHQFVISNNLIYSVNEQFKLWSYDLANDEFKMLGDMPRNLDYITDANETDILVSLRISAKKEVAELTLKD